MCETALTVLIVLHSAGLEKGEIERNDLHFKAEETEASPH